jgi:tetratricopeptide (TPR) repeat protein
MSSRLSVCLIVKDEADVLPRCLASLAGVADEIIAVDTGSTDASREILTAAGATVIESPWQDDFSLARNVSLDHATGDWVLVIDADEAIDPATGQNLRLLLIDTDKPVSYEVPIQNHTSDTVDPDQISLSWMPRLFNQPGGHRFVGRVHEYLVGSVPVRLDQSIFSLIHWGYQPSRIAARGKFARNDTLLATGLEQNADDPRSHLYAAMQATSPVDKLAHAEAILARSQSSWVTPAAIGMAGTLILQALIATAKWDEVVERAETLKDTYPTLAGEGMFLALEATGHEQLGDTDKARSLLQHAFDLVTGDRVLQSFWNEMEPVKTAMRLATALDAISDKVAAQAVLERALALPRLRRSAKGHLHGALASIAISQGDLETASRQTDQALTHNPDLRAMLANHFLKHQAVVHAMQLIAPILDPMALRDRVVTLSSTLVGAPQGLALLRWYLADHDSDEQLQFLLATHWLAGGDADQARTVLATGLQTDPGDVQIELRLAHAEQALGKIADAEHRLAAVVTAAAEANHQDWLAEALTQWGNLAFQQQQFDKATDLFTEAQSLRPQDPYLLVALGSAKAAAGDTPQARRHFERALLIDPDYAPAHQALTATEGVH